MLRFPSMSHYEQAAHDARGYGAEFVSKAMAVAGRLGMPYDWLLGIVSWETGGFKAVGPPWNARNAKDNGGGIIGFTGADGAPWEQMTPTQQLDLVERYYNKWKDEYGIDTFRSPIEAYWIVTGPWGLLMNPQSDVGGGRTRQWVVDTMVGVFTAGGVSWSDSKLGIEGIWNVRIGDWVGVFVFRGDGDIWYAKMPSRPPGSALPEIGYSDRTYGHWMFDNTTVRWRFGPNTDIRRFDITLPVNEQKWVGTIRPAGQGVFKMWRGSVEPD
jgi:hypothetical protein